MVPVESKEQGPVHRLLDAVKNKHRFSHFYEQVWVKKLVHKSKVRFGSWDICTLSGKSMKIVDTTARRKICFICLQETKMDR